MAIATSDPLEAKLLCQLPLDKQVLEEGLLLDFLVVQAPLIVSSLGVSTWDAVSRAPRISGGQGESLVLTPLCTGSGVHSFNLGGGV